MIDKDPSKQENTEKLLSKDLPTLIELRQLIELRGKEGLNKINSEFGGISGLCTKLHTDPNLGLLDDVDVLERKRIFGKNEIPMSPPKSFIQLVWEATKNFTLLCLLVPAVVSWICSIWRSLYHSTVNDDDDEQLLDWVECRALLFAAIVVVLLTAVNNYMKQNQFQELQVKTQTENKFSVLRGGESVRILANELVVGDIIEIKHGDLLPANGVLTQSSDLTVDESSLTGGSSLAEKSENHDPMLFSGTHVMEGNGRMVVTAVGVNSQAGVMALLGAMKTDKNKKNDTSNPEEPLTKEQVVLRAKIRRLLVKVGYISFFVGVCTTLILSARFIIHFYYIEEIPFSLNDIQYFINFIIIGFTVLLSAIPQPLPLAVIFSLAYCARKMMKDNNLVRHLDACETMGSATTICCDKTGTLTTNRMTVVQSFINEKFYRDSTPKFEELDRRTGQLLIEGISVNSSYASQVLDSAIGNKTECALLGFVLDLGRSYEDIREEIKETDLVKVHPFNSMKKSMMTVIHLPHNAGYRVYVKGAADMVLSRCKYILGGNREILVFDANKLTELKDNVLKPMASDGLRTIGLAYKDYVFRNAAPNEALISSEPDWRNEGDIREGMTAVAIAGIQDPVRPEAPEVIAKCQRAGITVRMVTGDDINTARSIAAACGILKPEDDFLVLEGKDFNARIRDSNGQVNQAKLDDIWPKLRVLARAEPSDKYVLVKGIIDSKTTKNREVVAVLGDGINDALALKKADVGVTMSTSSSDAAKEASDIILTDNNFTCIVKAVMWGRNLHDSIAKWLQFQLTLNVVVVFVAVSGACVIQDTPLKTVQMLWVNLFMSSFATLGLAAEVPSEDLLKRKPYGRTSSIISRTMVKNILGHAIYQLAILFPLIFEGERFFGIDSGRWAPLHSPPSEHFTIVFNAFVMMTLFNEVNARMIHDERNIFQGLCSNPIFCCIWITTMILQFLIVQYGGIWFSTTSLTLRQWLWCVVFGVGSLLWGQILATIPSCLSKNEVNYISEV